MVNNQVAQINTLTQQLNQIAAYTKAFGDPAKLLQVVGADALTHSLFNQTGINRTLGELRELSNGVSALQYNANGLYNTVTGISFSGVAVPRPEEVYRKFGAINQTAENYVAVYDDVFTRRKALKGQMAATTTQLQAATTDAETQKLTGVLVGQSAELEAIDRELEITAHAQAVVQDIENRNDEARQAQAVAEELAADRHDAMHKMGRMLIPQIPQADSKLRNKTMKLKIIITIIISLLVISGGVVTFVIHRQQQTAPQEQGKIEPRGPAGRGGRARNRRMITTRLERRWGQFLMPGHQVSDALR